MSPSHCSDLDVACLNLDHYAPHEIDCKPGEITQELFQLLQATGQTEKLIALLRQRLKPVLADHGNPPNRPSARDASIRKTPSSSLGCLLLEAQHHLAAQNEALSELLHAICL